MNRHPDVCYSLYLFFYDKPESEILDWEQKFLRDEGKSDSPDGRKEKTRKEFNVWWKEILVKRLASRCWAPMQIKTEAETLS